MRCSMTLVLVLLFAATAPLAWGQDDSGEGEEMQAPDESGAVYDEPVDAPDESGAVYDEPVGAPDESGAVYDQPVGAPEESGAVHDEPVGAPVVLPGGTRVTDTMVGTGGEALPGRMVAVHYTGWLWQDGMKGAKFDSSEDRDEAFVFPLGAGQAILGLDEGVTGMKVGGTRTLIVPPAAGYGAEGAGADVPPNSTLFFEVKLVAVQ